MMGSKTRARQNMKRAGVPFVPGSERGLDLDAAERLAEQIGYPVMLKAAAGGGGKGMRMVSSPEELHSAYENARSEAQRAFGDNEVYLEKFIVNPASRRDADLRRRAWQCGLSRRARVFGAAAASEGDGRVALADRR